MTEEANKQEQIWIEGYLKERWRCPMCGRAAPEDFCIVHSDVNAVDILKNERIQVMVLEEAKLHGRRGLKEHVLEYLAVKGAKPFISEEWLAKVEKSGKTFYHIKPQIDAWIDDSFEMEEWVKKEEREEELVEETIPKEFDWLVKEAEKYKTAEAFQKAQYATKPIPNTALGVETGLINWGVIPKSEEPHVLKTFWNLVHKNALIY